MSARSGQPIVPPGSEEAFRPEQKNIREVLRLERDALGEASLVDRLSETISRVASSPRFIACHILWFGAWIALNSRDASSFDPFPFSLLTMIVSLEAIVLTLFVMRSQTRMSVQAEQRAQLDQQINLLAEQELTAILRVLCAIGERLDIDVASCDPHVEQFRSRTDVRAIAAELDSEKAKDSERAKDSDRANDSEKAKKDRA